MGADRAPRCTTPDRRDGSTSWPASSSGSNAARWSSTARCARPCTAGVAERRADAVVHRRALRARQVRRHRAAHRRHELAATPPRRPARARVRRSRRRGSTQTCWRSSPARAWASSPGRSSWPNAPDHAPRARPRRGRAPRGPQRPPRRSRTAATGAAPDPLTRAPPTPYHHSTTGARRATRRRTHATADADRGPRRARAPPAPRRTRSARSTRTSAGETEDRAGLGAVGRAGPSPRAHASAPAARATTTSGELRLSRLAIAEPVDARRPDGRPAQRQPRARPATSPCSSAPCTPRPQRALRRQRRATAGWSRRAPCTRGRDGRPRPQRSERTRAVPPLRRRRRAAARWRRATRADGRECWCSVLPRTAPERRRARPCPAGRLLWADVDTPGTLWRARALRARLPVRLVVESGGAPDPREPRLAPLPGRRRAGWTADELEAANARLAELLGGDRVGDRGRLMRLPGTRNLKGGRPGRWCRVVACDLHAPARRRRGASLGAAAAARRGRRRSRRDLAAAVRSPLDVARAARVVRAARARPPDQRVRLRALPAARRPHPVAQALRRAARRLVLLGVRARRRPHRVRGVALARASQPRPRPVPVPRGRRPPAARVRGRSDPRCDMNARSHAGDRRGRR